MKRDKKYATLKVGDKLQEETVYVYSLSDNDMFNRDWRMYVWFVPGIKVKEIVNELKYKDALEILDDRLDSHHKFQVAVSSDFSETVEWITRGNYIWIDASELSVEAEGIFISESHEKQCLAVWESMA